MSTRGSTISVRTADSFFIETCYSCGVPFGIPSELQANLVQNRHSFYCPNGHSQSYTGKTDAEKLAEVQKRLEWEQTYRKQVEDQAQAAERSNKALKGVVTRKNRQLGRVKNGVCPCCNRSFKDLHRHITGQHPDYDPAAVSS